MAREKNTIILVRLLPGCLTWLFSHYSTTISFAAVLDHSNKMTGAKYDSEDDDGDDSGDATGEDDDNLRNNMTLAELRTMSIRSGCTGALVNCT